MNERILKLAKKSGATVNEGFDGTKNFVYGITMSPEELEKFALLIVREMCDVFDKRAKPGTGFYEPHEPAEMIREHFGVEL